MHVVEVGGSGGVFQHTASLVSALAADGVDVTLYTARSPEFSPRGVRLVECFDWHRSAPRRRRAIRIALDYVRFTLPSIGAELRRGDVLQVEGRFKPGFYSLLLMVGRIRGCRVVLSPHNLFAREGTRAARLALAVDLRLAQRVIVFSGADVPRVPGHPRRTVLSPLVMGRTRTAVDGGAVTDWRARWERPTGLTKVALFAGQVRPDKRLDVLLDAAAELPAEWRVAVVGGDLGAGAAARDQASTLDLDVVWDLDWMPYPRFEAALAAADVVVCPYEVASQSGVLAVAARLGSATAARAVGGLAEIATVSFADFEPENVASAILAADAAHVTAVDDTGAMVNAHRRAYGI